VCLSVTTITKTIVDGFVPNFMGRFLGEREDQVRVSLRSVEGCGSNGRKTQYLSIKRLEIATISTGISLYLVRRWNKNAGMNFAACV